MYKTMLIAVPLVMLAACDDSSDRKGRKTGGDGDDYELTEPDARMAVGQVDMISRPDVASVDVITVSTDITIGDRIDAIADRWRSFWESQAPCNTVTIDENVVVVDFGTLDDACAYGGDTFAGVDTITLTQIADFDDDLRVDHEWSGFTNGVVTLDGPTGVYWSGDGLRHVEFDHTLTDLASGAIVEARGQHTIRLLDPSQPGAEGGFSIDGARSWDDGTGQWSVVLVDLKMQLDDAAPFDGEAIVTSPKGHEMSIVYSRVDEDTTRALVTGPRGQRFIFRITAEGEPALE